MDEHYQADREGLEHAAAKGRTGMHWKRKAEALAGETCKLDAKLVTVADATIAMPVLGIPYNLRVDGRTIHGMKLNGDQTFVGLPSDWPVRISYGFWDMFVPNTTETLINRRKRTVLTLCFC